MHENGKARPRHVTVARLVFRLPAGTVASVTTHSAGPAPSTGTASRLRPAARSDKPIPWWGDRMRQTALKSCQQWAWTRVAFAAIVMWECLRILHRQGTLLAVVLAIVALMVLTTSSDRARRWWRTHPSAGRLAGAGFLTLEVMVEMDAATRWCLISTLAICAIVGIVEAARRFSLREGRLVAGAAAARPDASPRQRGE